MGFDFLMPECGLSRFAPLAGDLTNAAAGGTIGVATELRPGGTGANVRGFVVMGKVLVGSGAVACGIGKVEAPRLWSDDPVLFDDGRTWLELSRPRAKSSDAPIAPPTSQTHLVELDPRIVASEEDCPDDPGGSAVVASPISGSARVACAGRRPAKNEFERCRGGGIRRMGLNSVPSGPAIHRPGCRNGSVTYPSLPLVHDSSFRFLTPT